MSVSSREFCQYLPSIKTKIKNNHCKKEKCEVSTFLITPSPSHIKSKSQSISNSTHRVEKTSKINAQDYNIFHIDTKIREHLFNNIKSIPELQNKLSNMLWIIHNGSDSTQKVMANQQVSLLRKRIQDRESTLELALYIFMTLDILQDYRKLVELSGDENFVIATPTKFDTNLSKMDVLIARYLCIAQDYIEIENFSHKPQKMTCPACQELEFTLSIDDESIYICKSCRTEIEILDDAPSFKDTDRVNMSSKYTYTKKGHFIDAERRFQGTQNVDPQKIQYAVSVLKDQMEKHNLIANQNQPTSVSKDHIYMFLSEQGLSGHYADLNLLFHIITGEPCPDISMYEDKLNENFDQQEEAQRIQDTDRVNSLNVNYKLYKLLQHNGYPCKKEDFYILKTKTKEDEHDETLKEAWGILGWTWVPTF
uniref:Late transcription factor 3-like protein n=1 Tax=Marseillevirus LCMAC102 TaxID=2506603 RepID=A0A481YST7_9VIRU|nr:MAG: late transcription factor 3-like protein [Marseillevirus LCMAC102]